VLLAPQTVQVYEDPGRRPGPFDVSDALLYSVEKRPLIGTSVRLYPMAAVTLCDARMAADERTSTWSSVTLIKAGRVQRRRRVTRLQRWRWCRAMECLAGKCRRYTNQ
jgi:hypothetical protein